LHWKSFESATNRATCAGLPITRKRPS
jgi:hypothetical protein